MIRIENPLALFAVFAIFVAGLVVYPAMRTERFRVTVAKFAALVVALSVCLYNGTFAFFFVFLWPLSLIWFPEYWGGYTGILRGPYIDKKSPPILVSLMGWFFLVVFPLLLWWIMGR